MTVRTGNTKILREAQMRRDWWSEPFGRMVVLGESTVEGGGWLGDRSERWCDVLARLINECQSTPVEYVNKGIGANAISPRSPGYAMSRKPSAMERYRTDVIEQKPDLFVLCYGLNDMRAAMPVDEFVQDLRTIIVDVKRECAPLTVLTTVYYMTGWKSWPPYDRGSKELTYRYNDAVRKLAHEQDCIVADLWDAEGEADWLINPDGVHANRVGSLLIAHRVFEAIANHCSALSKATYERDLPTQWTQQTMKARADVGDPHDPWWAAERSSPGRA